MNVVTAAEMAALDQGAIQGLGLPGAVLMETAGRALAYSVARLQPSARRILVVCGPGNNGGDGFVAARTLLALGREATCLLVGRQDRLSGDAALHASAYAKAGGTLLEIPAAEGLPALAPGVDLVVDALFGTGLRRPLEGLAAGVVEWINRSGFPVAAADLPSGVCSDTGRVLGRAVRATFTVTMGLPKRGLFLHPGAELAGRLVVAEIGLAPLEASGPDLPGALLTESVARGLLPGRPPTAHKGSCGSVLLVGGSRQYPGAPALAAEAALRVGAGLVTLACPGEIRSLVAAWRREILTVPLASPQGCLVPGDLELLLPLPDKVRALCLGPGLAGGEETREAVRQLLARTTLPVVLDADALRAVAGRGRLRPKVVLTPHPGEMSALTGVSPEELEADRVGWALRCAERYGAVVVMKGAPTVVADAEGRKYWINTSGGAMLAQGGTGDVLAGALAGFLAQGVEPARAACAAVYLHGKAGEACASQQGTRGILAGEVAGALPRVLQDLLDRVPVDLDRAGGSVQSKGEGVHP